MTNATSCTQERREPEPESWARPPTSAPVVDPPTASRPRTIVGTSKAASRVAAQAPDPRTHAGQRRQNLDGASYSTLVASLTDAQPAEGLGRLIGIITTTIVLEVPADPHHRHNLVANEQSWLAC